MRQEPAAVEAAELKQWLRDGNEIAIVDAREEDSFAAAHLLRASCLPLSRLEQIAPRLLPRRSLRTVVCDAGNGLAQRAAERLWQGGYTAVSVLAGGIDAWRQAGFPLYSGVHVPSKAFAECVEHEAGTPAMAPVELAARVAAGEDLVIFDSRSFEEYHANSIPGAVSVPGAELIYRFQDLVPSPDTLVVVNCGGRTRSIIGAQALISAGVPNKVWSLVNGTMGWHLAGYEVIRGAERKPPPPSAHALAYARPRARAMAEAAGVEVIDGAALDRFRREAAAHTLYILDVRDPPEYAACHLPDAVSVAGGQLVQETDNWVASRLARVVLVDPAGIRSRVTGWWLRQMGFLNVYVLDGDAPPSTTAERPSIADFPLAGPDPKAIEAVVLADRMAGPGITVVDVGLSKPYRLGHIPGAWHAVRARLADNVTKLPATGAFVVTSEDGEIARFAAAELMALTGRDAAWLRDGTAAWKAAGLPVEEGLTHLLDTPDDIWLPPRERGAERERLMNEYLTWEIDLVNQAGQDPDFGFRLAVQNPPGRHAHT